MSASQSPTCLDACIRSLSDTAHDQAVPAVVRLISCIETPDPSNHTPAGKRRFPKETSTLKVNGNLVFKLRVRNCRQLSSRTLLITGMCPIPEHAP